MKLTDLKQSHEKLKGLSNEQIEGIFELIDLKTEDDMEKALQKMDIIKHDLLKNQNDNLKWIIGAVVAIAGLVLAIVKLMS